MVHMHENINIIKSILVGYAKTGAKFEDIKDDYFELVGEEFSIAQNINQFYNFLRGIPGIRYERNYFGEILWFIHSEKSEHIQKMVLAQNSGGDKNRRIRRLNKMPYSSRSQNRQNYFHTRNQYSMFSQQNRWNNNHMNENEASIYDHQLIGDDFFLSLAKLELGCSFKRGHFIRQSGFCISGQTISDAVQRIYQNPYINDRVIINLGSVDLLHGHDLIDMEADFLCLMDVLRNRGIEPIITTLPPLANFGHLPEVRKNLEKFNNFLRYHDPTWIIIDVCNCLTDNGKILYNCYQPEARYVTGSSQPHVLWNKIGRQRILKHIKRSLGDLQ